MATTKITVIDRPCGVGKTTDLIKRLKSLTTTHPHMKFLIVVPELGEVKRFQDALGKDYFRTPMVDTRFINEGEPENKTDVLIDLLGIGENAIITHALYERIRKFEHLLHDYHVVVDEVPTVAKQVSTMFGPAIFKNLLHEKNYIDIDPITKLITATNNWIVDADDYHTGDDVHVRQFMDKIMSADVYYISGTYCLMPLPDAFFTYPKTLTILTFLFEGTQLEHYMIKRGYGFYLQTSPNELAQFKYKMNANLQVCRKTTKHRTGYEVMTAKPTQRRKQIGNFIRNLIHTLNKNGFCFTPDRILVASHKDSWFGAEESSSSKVTNQSRLKALTRLGDATYTALITRGTNKFKSMDILIMLGKVNLHPGLAEFLGMRTKKAKDMHALSELIQLIYRTAIRDNKEVFFISPDRENIRLIREFLNS